MRGRRRNAPRSVGSYAGDVGDAATNDLSAGVAAHSWYHSIELPGEVTTPGVVDSRRVAPRYRLPASLAGLRVLDIGAWDGFWSFEAARLGADDVLATDSFSWNGSNWGSKEPFLFARRALGLEGRVRDLDIDPTDLTPEAVGGEYDVVLFLGVMYHLEDPIGVLRRVASCCRGLLVLETESTLNWLPFPAARVFPDDSLNGDATNWYQYNARALHGLLREMGFESSTTVFRTPLWRRLGRAMRDRLRGRSFRASFLSSRIVIHARR